jgi:hypothetical protein
MAADVAEVLTSFSAYAEPRDGVGDNPFKLGCSLTVPATSEEISSVWPGAPPGDLVQTPGTTSKRPRRSSIDQARRTMVTLAHVLVVVPVGQTDLVSSRHDLAAAPGRTRQRLRR